MDLIINGQAQGDVASTLMANNFDVGSLRPYVGNDGRSYITQNRAGKMVSMPTPVGNATLRYNEWKLLDEAVIVAAKERLRVVAQLRAAGLTYNIPNGMGKTVLMTESQSDITGAVVSMDPSRQSEGDRPEYNLVNLPLPVIHKDFSFNARQIATSRNIGASIDVTTAQLAARRVAEEAEKLALGVSTVADQYAYGGGTIYGLTDFPQRLTKVMTNPTVSNWTPNKAVIEILAMRQQSIAAFHYGPYVIFNSPNWDQFLDEDYTQTKGDNTLRQRILSIQGINDLVTADFLTGYQMILVQQTADVIREVIGMDITTVQWETQGGMKLNFKVMAILVPQLRADFNGNTGIVHGTAV